MLKLKLFTVFVFLRNLIGPCVCDDKANNFQETGKAGYKISRVGKFPKDINENSGLVALDSAGTTLIYTFNDGGGKPEVYITDINGCLLNKIHLVGARNFDWEAITKDNKGNIFIGDIGNNLNLRKELVIYKWNLEREQLAVIRYSYPDQNSFPPPLKNRNFDAEAFFVYKDSLYIFSKNRGSKCVKVYAVPTREGKYIARLVDSTFLSGMITDASVNPSGTTFALASYGKLYFFKVDDKVSFRNPLYCRRFARSGQSEGLSFFNEKDLIITNEGRKIWRMSKK